MKKNTRSVLQQLSAITAVFISRLHLLPANVSSLGSFGFFGNPLLYFASIVLFDRFIGGFYGGFWFTYLGFAMYPLMGWLAKRNKSATWLLLPSASFLFFIVSNFGSWYYWYPRTIDGLILCYSLAIPFYARTLTGDLVFGYGYMLIKSKRTSSVINHMQYYLSNRNKVIFLSK
ncbi:hypothetical protein KA012_04795 [Candidatus Woesebacteria bacterium]|nr:hypothetical protein [Candidatus Woesebacteria bacterium]